MVFSSLSFLLYFLPAAAAGYFLCPGRLRNLWLLCASLLFCWLGDASALLPVTVMVLWTWGTGRLLASRASRPGGRWLLMCCTAADLGVLIYFKYFTAACPPGLSFLTFLEISYAADAFRSGQAEKDPVRTGLYLLFFPKMVSGPLLRYREFDGGAGRMAADLPGGFFRFCRGLCRKVLIADRLGALTVHVFGTGWENRSGGLLLLGVLAWALQLYTDFSAYSHMAIGLGAMFGFRLPENFRTPYLSGNGRDFWRRWHITLGAWFRDYVYIPLGGSRGTAGQTVRNLLLVWLLTGLWHGASLPCLLWGLLWGLLLAAERFLLQPEQRSARFRRIYRVCLIMAAMALFSLLRLTDLSQVLGVWSRIFSPAAWSLEGQAGRELAFWCHEEWLYLAAAAAVGFGLPEQLAAAGQRSEHPALLEAGKLLALLAGLLLTVSLLAGGAGDPFLYQQF